MYYIAQALHVPQAILSAYGLYLSYSSIQNLRQYEETSEKAAGWSQTAADQLHLTRTTQASGAIAILFSFSSAVLLLGMPNDIPDLARYLLSPAVLLTTLFARGHVASFWEKKAKVPFVDGYNEAIGTTTQILRVLRWLEFSWLGASFVSALAGY